MINKCRIAKLLHPVKIVVQRVIDAVVATETHVQRRNARKIEEGTKIRARSQSADGRLARSLCLELRPRDTVGRAFFLRGMLSPDVIHATPCLGIFYLARHITHNFFQRWCRPCAEVRSRYPDIRIYIRD